MVKTLTQATATDGYYWSVNDLNIDTTYWLVETKAPAGHSLLPQPIEFTLKAARASGSGTTVELAARPDGPGQVGHERRPGVLLGAWQQPR